jgi:hypothetical protein
MAARQQWHPGQVAVQKPVLQPDPAARSPGRPPRSPARFGQSTVPQPAVPQPTVPAEHGTEPGQREEGTARQLPGQGAGGGERKLADCGEPIAAAGGAAGDAPPESHHPLELGQGCAEERGGESGGRGGGGGVDGEGDHGADDRRAHEEEEQRAVQRQLEHLRALPRQPPQGRQAEAAEASGRAATEAAAERLSDCHAPDAALEESRLNSSVEEHLNAGRARRGGGRSAPGAGAGASGRSAAIEAALRGRKPHAGWRELRVGSAVDVLDDVCLWASAAVVEVTAAQVKVHYHGWGVQFDEWLRKSSRRLAPAASQVYSEGGTLRRAQRLDVLDTVSKWCEASVVEEDPDRGRVKVHYRGWASKFDEWIACADAHRFAPFGSRSAVDLSLAA